MPILPTAIRGGSPVASTLIVNAWPANGRPERGAGFSPAERHDAPVRRSSRPPECRAIVPTRLPSIHAGKEVGRWLNGVGEGARLNQRSSSSDDDVLGADLKTETPRPQPARLSGPCRHRRCGRPDLELEVAHLAVESLRYDRAVEAVERRIAGVQRDVLRTPKTETAPLAGCVVCSGRTLSARRARSP